jgi:hypothetical protein
VANQVERIESQLLHDLNLVLGHGPLGVVDVLRAAFRFAAVAVTPEVRCDDGKVLGQKRGYFVPHDVRLGIAVE